MVDRTTFSTGTEYEKEVGYARAVRKGGIVKVSGTVAVEDGEVVAPDDPYEQATFVLDRIETSLDEVGASIEDVIHTRIYLTDFDDWRAVGRAHHEVFADVEPANTTIEVNRFVGDGLRVEIDVEAVTG